MHRRAVLTCISGALGSLYVLPQPARAGTASEMMHVPMSDGAVIGLEAAGVGPSVLLVQGSGTSRKSWAKVAPLLQSRFRTFAMDRRGRGDSTDAADYSLQREAQDVVEVANALPAPVFVVGHSIGAIMTLEALRLTDRFQKAVLYEPPPARRGRNGGQSTSIGVRGGRGWRQRPGDYGLLQRLRDDASSDGSRLSQGPSWPQRIKLAPTVCREATAHYTYRFRPDQIAKVSTPTLFLLGGDSPKAMAVSTRAGAAALPHGQVELLPGQQHVATQMAPDLLARDITDSFCLVALRFPAVGSTRPLHAPEASCRERPSDRQRRVASGRAAPVVMSALTPAALLIRGGEALTFPLAGQHRGELHRLDLIKTGV